MDNSKSIRFKFLVRFVLIIAFLVSCGPVARADSYVANGLEFSDELGGFRLMSVAGKGSKSDPFVVMEQIYAVESVVLVIRRFNELRAGINQVPLMGIHIRKVVTNATQRAWFNFDMELRESLGNPSGYWDGLSFDQIGIDTHRFASDRFLMSRDQKEPYDALAFRNGLVRPGDTVTFDIFITDPTPVAEFFLMQTSVGPIVRLPQSQLTASIEMRMY